ncbi:hypothetical protein ACFE04_031722 [Oxalis oulophora]
MPELPEVEVARRAITEHCLNKKIKKAIIANDDKVIDGISPSDFESSILGKTIVAAHRKGKNLWLHLDSPPFPSFQFGMAGAIHINGVAVAQYKRSAVKDTDEWPSKYSKFFIELDDGLELSFTDKRRFAKVRLLQDPTSVPPISELGPDALFEPMTVDEFTKSLGKKKLSIKTLLLDQSYISGIGNWVADEVLYQAKIHPLQIASSLSKESCRALHKSIDEVVQYSVKVDDDSTRFPPEWLFHYRWGKKAGKVNGMQIDFITAGGRTTAYVPELQKLSGGQVVKAANKPKRPSKRKGVEDDDENDADAPESEAEKAKEIAKPKKLSNPRGRKPATRKKSNESGDDNDGNRNGHDDDGNSDHEDEDDDVDVEKKKPRKVADRKQAKATSTKMVTSQNSKKLKVKAK